MGESSTQIIEGPQPKPSRFQFVPVPGEFTRGRWKCRDSYHPNAETLEFEKNKTKEEANPEKISVFFKLRQPEEEESTIQVTSVETKDPDTTDEISNSSESIIITRKNASMAVVDTTGIQSVMDTSLSPHQTRKPSNEEKTDSQKLMEPTITTSVSSPALPLETPKPTRHFQVEPVVLSEPSTPAPVAPAPSIETLVLSPETRTDVPSLNEPTFQVIQTEESKNMSMDSVKNVIDAALVPPPTDRLNNVDEVETPTNVMITVSAAVEKKEAAAAAGSVSSLDAFGIPIAGPQITAPHSTPYGTPKDTQNAPVFEEVFSTNTSAPPPPIITTTSAPTTAPASSPVSSSIPASASASASALPSIATTAATVNTSTLTTPSTTDSHTPIDNKIEQAMELVKTHLTYAVREEVDTLRNTIAELEYQMREYQYECNFYRQNCSAEIVDQAAAFVHQQMATHQRPTRKAVSTTSVIFDGVSTQNATASASASSAHMRNLQNQIQQMKQSYSRSFLQPFIPQTPPPTLRLPSPHQYLPPSPLPPPPSPH
uniref:Flocculation protein FLO11-like n=1 Tax=Caenorhabditis tropicalis TaxID=1561998 RepID=A0A1I7UUH2_9PELO